MKKTFLLAALFTAVIAAPQASFALVADLENVNDSGSRTTSADSGGSRTSDTDSGGSRTTSSDSGGSRTTDSDRGGSRTTSTGPDVKVATLPNPLGDKISDIPSLLYKVINFVVGLSYAVVAFFLILSGFKFVAARGNPDKLDDAKHTFYYTIIGALIVIGANTVVKIFEGLIKSLGL